MCVAEKIKAYEEWLHYYLEISTLQRFLPFDFLCSRCY